MKAGTARPMYRILLALDPHDGCALRHIGGAVTHHIQKAVRAYLKQRGCRHPEGECPNCLTVKARPGDTRDQKERYRRRKEAKQREESRQPVDRAGVQSGPLGGQPAGGQAAVPGGPAEVPPVRRVHGRLARRVDSDVPARRRPGDGAVRTHGTLPANARAPRARVRQRDRGGLNPVPGSTVEVIEDRNATIRCAYCQALGAPYRVGGRLYSCKKDLMKAVLDVQAREVAHA